MERTSDELAEQIGNCAKLCQSALVDHKTYLRADAAAKNLNMAKYRAEVLREIDEMKSSQSEVLEISCGIVFEHLDMKFCIALLNMKLVYLHDYDF